MVGVTAIRRKKPKFFQPVRGRVTSQYGYRIHPFTKKRSFHKGVDIPLKIGTYIYSPLAGKVLSWRTNKTGGRQLIITHKGGFTSGYAHLGQRLVRSGEKVERGQLIARSGQTGKVTAPHLHFTWKKDGKYKNPERYFSF